MKHIIVSILIFFSLPIYALRVVSLAPNITEMLFAIGAGSQVVAVDSASDLPQEVRKLPNVGNYQQINLEKIIALHPDMIIAAPVSIQQQQLQELRKFNIIIHYLVATQLTDVADNLRQLGQWTDHQRVANKLAQQYLIQLIMLQHQYHVKKPVTVFYELWQRPLLTINSETVTGQIISLCGGQNIFAHKKNNGAAIIAEAVIAEHPEVIIINNSANESFWKHWLPQSKIILLNADQSQRYAPSLLKATNQLCRELWS